MERVSSLVVLSSDEESSSEMSSESYHENLNTAAILNLNTKRLSHDGDTALSNESGEDEIERIQKIIRKSSVVSPSPSPTRKLSWKTEVEETSNQRGSSPTSRKLSWTSTNGPSQRLINQNVDEVINVQLPRSKPSSKSSLQNSRNSSRMEYQSTPRPEEAVPVTHEAFGNQDHTESAYQVNSDSATCHEGESDRISNRHRSRRDCAFNVRKRDKSWDQKWMEHLQKSNQGSSPSSWNINREPVKINSGVKWDSVRTSEPSRNPRSNVTKVKFNPDGSCSKVNNNPQKHHSDSFDGEENMEKQDFLDSNKDSSPPVTRQREYVSPGRPPMSPRSLKRRMIIRVRKSPSPAALDADSRAVQQQQQVLNPQIYERYCAALEEERLKEEQYLQELHEVTSHFHNNIDHIEKSFEQLVQGVIHDFNENSYDGTFRAVPAQVREHQDHVQGSSETKLQEESSSELSGQESNPVDVLSNIQIPDDDSLTEGDTTSDSYQVYEIEHEKSDKAQEKEFVIQQKLERLEEVAKYEQERLAQIEIQERIHQEELRKTLKREEELKRKIMEEKKILEEYQRKVFEEQQSNIQEEQRRIQQEQRRKFEEEQKIRLEEQQRAFEEQKRFEDQQRQHMEMELKRREMEARQRLRWEEEQAQIRALVEEQKEREEMKARQKADEKEQLALKKQMRTSHRGSQGGLKSNAYHPKRAFETFETNVKEKAFSVSGMWNKVDLGIVKQKKDFWLDQSDDVDTMSQTAQRSKKTRTINPNAWIDHPPGKSEVRKDKDSPKSGFKVIHKAQSSGDLAQELEEVEHKTLSSGVGAWEQRDTGRKSADIFMHNDSLGPKLTPFEFTEVPAVMVETVSTPNNERKAPFNPLSEKKVRGPGLEFVPASPGTWNDEPPTHTAYEVKNALIRPIGTQKLNDETCEPNHTLTPCPPQHHHDPWLSRSQEYLPLHDPNSSLGGPQSLSLLSVNLSPSSSVVDLSSGRSSPTDRSGHSSYFKKGRRRRKSTKIAQDIARRAEEFARFEKERIKRDFASKINHEQFLKERENNQEKIVESSLKKKILHPKDQAKVPDLGDKERVQDCTDPALPSDDRLNQVQADLARQKAEEQARLQQIEQDRLRQIEENERLSAIPTTNQLNLAQVIENKKHDIAKSMQSRSADDDFTPDEVRARIAQKLENKRKKEARKSKTDDDDDDDDNNNVGKSGVAIDASSASIPKTSYVIGQKSNGSTFGSRHNNKKSMSGHTDGKENIPVDSKPVPPKRDLHCEAKAISRMAKTKGFPTQQERWKMRKAHEEKQRQEWEELQKLEEEQQEMLFRVEEKQLHHEELSRQESDVMERGIEALRNKEPISPPPVTNPPPLRRMSSLSMDEDKKLAEWQELKRRESEKEELHLREMERQIQRDKRDKKSPSFDPVEELPLPPPPAPPPLPRNPPRPPPPKQASAEEQIQDWELMKRQEEEAQEMMMREMERQANPKCAKPSLPSKQKPVPKPLVIKAHSTSDARVSPTPVSPVIRQTSDPDRRIPVIEPLCVEMKTYQTTGSSTGTLGSPSICSSQEQMLKQQKEWEDIQRRQEEDEERMRLELERELLKEREHVDEERKAKVKLDDMNIERTRLSMKENTIEEGEEEEDVEMPSKKDAILDMKLKKQEIEDELAREKAHLEELQRIEREVQISQVKRAKPKAAEQYEKMVATGQKGHDGMQTLRATSVSPSFEVHETQRIEELEKIKQLKQLEKQKLKELDEIRRQNLISNSPSIPNNSPKTSSAKPGQSTSLEDHRISSCSEDELYQGMSEASLGIENEQSSGNVTPIPTTGELEDIHHLKHANTPHLKSLLKKASFDNDDGDVDTLLDPEASAKSRGVQFSEVNQFKILTPCPSASSIVKEPQCSE
ncbi:trichohyalin-like [Tigriopus californicus]|uniref:trichohyalin-like n=1 Tax=Tigriopus californicus TaxID=6832 RepID=UPI0027D9E48C|nr:trichohyalin-like [Tigriopus californicus]